MYLLYGLRELLVEYYLKQTPWPLVRERIIPTKRPPVVDEL
jgi:hypothetical protein